jgi:hypothetical protein
VRACEDLSVFIHIFIVSWFLWENGNVPFKKKILLEPQTEENYEKPARMIDNPAEIGITMIFFLPVEPVPRCAIEFQTYTKHSW